MAPVNDVATGTSEMAAMTPPAGPSLVCATRGGPGSRDCQLAAIARANESDLRLHFAFVVDDAVLPPPDDVLRPAVETEMAWLGRALLALAAHRAADHGRSAECVLLRGSVWSAIAGFVREIGATEVYIGARRGDRPLPLAPPEGLRQALAGFPVLIVQVASGRTPEEPGVRETAGGQPTSPP